MEFIYMIKLREGAQNNCNKFASNLKKEYSHKVVICKHSKIATKWSITMNKR